MEVEKSKLILDECSKSSSITTSITFDGVAMEFMFVWSWLIFIIYQDLKLNKFCCDLRNLDLCFKVESTRSQWRQQKRQIFLIFLLYLSHFALEIRRVHSPLRNKVWNVKESSFQFSWHFHIFIQVIFSFTFSIQCGSLVNLNLKSNLSRSSSRAQQDVSNFEKSKMNKKRV